MAFVIYSLAPRSLRQWKNTENVNLRIILASRESDVLRSSRRCDEPGWRGAGTVWDRAGELTEVTLDGAIFAVRYQPGWMVVGRFPCSC